MALIAPQPDPIFIDNIEVLIMPVLTSNLSFIRADHINVRLTDELIDYLKSLGYSVKKPEFGPQAGGSGLLWADFVNLVKSINDVIEIVSLLLSMFKAINRLRFLRKYKVSKSNQPIIQVELRYTTHNQLNEHENGVFLEASRICSSLLSASNEGVGYLRSRYPNMIFAQRITLVMDHYRSMVEYEFTSSKDSRTNYRLDKLFKAISLTDNTISKFSIGKLIISRTDSKVSEEYESSWSTDPKLDERYYFIIPGRIFPHDYISRLRQKKVLG